MIKVGDIITFGKYEQDNTIQNGKEDIQWTVLEIKESKALLISKYALDCQQYNSDRVDVTWGTCSLRKWLNNDFLKSAFTELEIETIATEKVPADKNTSYLSNSTPGRSTRDKIFLLSLSEANRHFPLFSGDCKPTAYAKARGAQTENKNCYWWLRSPGIQQILAATVDRVGCVRDSGCYVDNTNAGIRPAMWIDISKIQ